MRSGCKVLLVEDNDDVRKVMNLLLKGAGCEVVAASTVAEAIAKLDGQAVALLDVFLPDGSGVDVLAHIRNQKHHTRIALVTAAFDTDPLKNLLSPGDAIFSKPVDFADLLKWMSLG